MIQNFEPLLTVHKQSEEEWYGNLEKLVVQYVAQQHEIDQFFAFLLSALYPCLESWDGCCETLFSR